MRGERSMPRHAIEHLVSDIIPFDSLEDRHIQETLQWIRSGEQIFRLKKPDIPPQHLVSYFLLLDEEAQKILLVDHKKAQLWLPSGGHVDEGEHPRQTVIRECGEELAIDADFWQEDPLFITITPTVGLTAGHTDVSLWYVLKGNHTQVYAFDEEEFHTVQWFAFDAIPYEKADPHLPRFMGKLKTYLRSS